MRSRAHHPAPELPVERLEHHHARRAVDHRADDQRQRAQLVALHVEDLRELAEQDGIDKGRHHDHEQAGGGLGEMEARGAHAHREAHQQLAQGTQAQDAPAEVHVLHPACGRSRQHPVGLASRQPTVDHDEQEGVEQPRLQREDPAQRSLHEQRGHDGERGPEDLHRALGVARTGARGASLGSGGRTSCVQASSSARVRITISSSSRSKRAEGATRMSLNRPPLLRTDCTRPTIRPLGNMRSSPEVTTMSPTATSASTGTYFMASRFPTWSAKPAWPETTAVMRLRSMRTPSPLSWSSRSCTLAACGPTATTRPTTPVVEMTGALRETPSSRPRLSVTVRNQGTPSV